jgi:hypothetical protein
MWVRDESGQRVPMELIMYRSNQHTSLPFYTQDFEDEEFFYIVTGLHGIPRKDKSLLGSRYHAIDWQAHWK